MDCSPSWFSDSEADSDLPNAGGEEKWSGPKPTPRRPPSAPAACAGPSAKAKRLGTLIESQSHVTTRRSAQSGEHRRPRSRTDSSTDEPDSTVEQTASMLKSPTSPSSSSFGRTKNSTNTPIPPLPIVPRRQPSFTALAPMEAGIRSKTLIIDLDETLIHSISKDGQFTTGHMVEVHVSQPTDANGIKIGSEVPILYYVRKRPHCDEFLRKASKWYNLIVFTASVQAYADPVIDWLELERQYFQRRYYRQHCTFRNGAYIKDLSQIEPDLSKVVIVDNSPISYAFHEDNAIPIEGWINDPTDNHLLHIVPLLEGLQHVTDVRAVLTMRLGQPNDT